MARFSVGCSFEIVTLFWGSCGLAVKEDSQRLYRLDCSSFDRNMSHKHLCPLKGLIDRSSAERRQRDVVNKWAARLGLSIIDYRGLLEIWRAREQPSLLGVVACNLATGMQAAETIKGNHGAITKLREAWSQNQSDRVRCER